MSWKEPQESLSTPFISYFHPEILPHFIKRNREKQGNLCCQHKNSSQCLFVTPSSLIPTFLLPSVLEEAIWCLQMPGSLRGRSNHKHISRCQQALEAILWQGRAGQGWVLSPEQTSQPCSTLSWEVFAFQSAAKASQQCLDKHTCPVPGVLPQGCCMHPGLGTEPCHPSGAGWSPKGFQAFHQSQEKAQVKGMIPHRASGHDLLDSHSAS